MKRYKLKCYKKKEINCQQGYRLTRGYLRRFRVKQMEMRKRPRCSPPRYWINRKYPIQRQRGGKILVGLLSPDASRAEIEAFYRETMAMIEKAKQQN